MSEPDWFQIFPFGEFPHKETGLTQVLDRSAVASILRNFKDESAAPNFPGLLVDFDHFSQDIEQASEAAGWIDELAERPDGLWGHVRWTDAGEDAVSSGRYRLASPTWKAADVERLGGKKIRPLRLDQVALTNTPQIKGSKPISNSNRSRNEPALKEWLRNSEAAGQVFSNRVADLREQNPDWNFERAWNQARQAEPLLFSAMCPRPAASAATPLTNRAWARNYAVAVGGLCGTLANRYAQRYGMPFLEAWDFARSQHPEVFEQSYLVDRALLNRYDPSAAIFRPGVLERANVTVPPDHAAIIEKSAPAIYADMESRFYRTRSEVPMCANGGAIDPKALFDGVFKAINQMHVLNPTWDFRACWDKYQEEHPQYWGTMVVSVGAAGDSGGAGSDWNSRPQFSGFRPGFVGIAN